MKKSELIQSVAEKAGLTQAQAARAVNALTATISEGLAVGDRVPLIGFGTFDVRLRAARRGRHPATGRPMEIPARNRVRFRAGKELKSVV